MQTVDDTDFTARLVHGWTEVWEAFLKVVSELRDLGDSGQVILDLTGCHQQETSAIACEMRVTKLKLADASPIV
eukprot:6208347-Amphidinium_carterae.2